MRKLVLMAAIICGSYLTASAQSIFQIISDSPVHNTLQAALEAAGLDGVLNGPGNFTIFAPNDDAFAALGQEAIDDLLADPSGALTEILLYHVLPQVVFSGSLADGQTWTTLQGQDVTVTIDNGVFINEAQVIQANEDADNGVLHVIDGVLLPDLFFPCFDFAGGPYIDFNTGFGGAPAPEDGVCPVFQITTFQAWASERYIIENFVAGVEYNFSICEGPGAGSWDPELYVFDTDGEIVAYAEDCEITWVSPGSGTYFIGIQEVGFCGTESPNLNTGNGNLTLSCNGAGVANTVWDIIVGSPDHETLESVIELAGLEGALSGDGPLTVFAPTDAAFAAVPTEILMSLLADPEGLLTSVLLYHVVGAAALSTSLSDGQVIETLEGQSVTVTITGGNVFINNAQVTVADVIASNGVVHVIDAVLVPDLPTVWDIVVNSDVHNTLESVVLLAGLDGALSGPGPLTLFAPTDAAFDAVPAETLASLTADPSGLLTQVLLYHVVSGAVYSGDLTDGMSVPTLNGENVSISITGSTVMVGNANGMGTVTIADIGAINGVVHVIDAVLVPVTLNVNHLAAVNSLNIYPNPTKFQFTVDLDMAASERITIDLVNLLGQKVKGFDLGMRSDGLNREYIDVTGVPAGFYLLTITVGNNQVVQKVQILK